MENLVVISGCSGGGKSSLLRELERRGHAVVEEPGRRIVRQEMEIGGSALPWVDAELFARRAIELAIEDLTSARTTVGWTFFDRGLVDAAAALRHVTGEDLAGQHRWHRYRRLAFFAPPWPELYVSDRERRHDFDEAVAEYNRLQTAYPEWGYDLCLLPQATVSERADFVEAELQLS